MRIIGLAFALLLSACVSVPPERHVERALFEEACAALELDCSELQPPIVVQSSVVVGTGNWGFTYPDEDFVFINPYAGADPSYPTYAEVVFHETIHYILANLDPVDVCESERVARVLTDQRAGREYDPSWEYIYGCQAH